MAGAGFAVKRPTIAASHLSKLKKPIRTENDVMTNPNLPGKLGDPSRTILNDPRTDPRIAATLEAVGNLGAGISIPGPDASYQENLEYCATFEASAAQMHPMVEAAMPDYPTVKTRVETISGVDGNDIPLYIHEPAEPGSSPRRCIFHTHGGGMAIMTAADPGFVRYRNDLAAAGLVVVGVEFLNAAASLGNHPFPAGLNDCASALQWTVENKQSLNIDKIVLSGESGGGNLAIANALKAKQDGNDYVDGVYAMCPYISGAYADPPSNLVSLVENDGYTLGCEVMVPLVRCYDPNGEFTRNPLAWPYFAEAADLDGLPPFVISVNELDPLRDEGLAFAQKLKQVNVSAVARTVNGTHHAGDVSIPDVVPDIYEETVRSLVGFANSI